MTRKEAIFNVLNEWFDLPQEAFNRAWPELEAAIEAPEPEYTNHVYTAHNMNVTRSIGYRPPGM